MITIQIEIYFVILLGNLSSNGLIIVPLLRSVGLIIGNMPEWEGALCYLGGEAYNVCDEVDHC